MVEIKKSSVTMPVFLLSFPTEIALIVAGNEGSYGELSKLLQDRNNTYFTENVMPDVNKLNPIPVRKIYPKSFLRKNCSFKGDPSSLQLTQITPIIPTPKSCISCSQAIKKKGHKLRKVWEFSRC